MVNLSEVILKTEMFVKGVLEQDSSGHDWWHIDRVRKAALKIGKIEKASLFIIEMAALLHDISDEKLNVSEEAGVSKVVAWLNELKVNPQDQAQIIDIITTISYKGGQQHPVLKTIEAKVVQDADRLDAIGAIGIARTFAYAGATGGLIYDPNIQYRENVTKEEYRNGKSTAINHFYEKLLKLSSLLHTETARNIAKERHLFLETFLNQFYKEWNG